MPVSTEALRAFTAGEGELRPPVGDMGDFGAVDRERGMALALRFLDAFDIAGVGCSREVPLSTDFLVYLRGQILVKCEKVSDPQFW